MPTVLAVRVAHDRLLGFRWDGSEPLDPSFASCVIARDPSRGEVMVDTTGWEEGNHPPCPSGPVVVAHDEFRFGCDGVGHVTVLFDDVAREWIVVEGTQKIPAEYLDEHA